MSVEKYWNCTSKWELNKDDTFCHLKRTMHQSVLIRIMSVMFSIGTDTGGGGGGGMRSIQGLSRVGSNIPIAPLHVCCSSYKKKTIVGLL